MAESPQTARIAHVRYDDGTSQELDLGRPMIAYQLAKLGIDLETEDAVTGSFLAGWIAAGSPGRNGHGPTRDEAVGLMEQWLAHVTDFLPGGAEDPPTKPQAKRRR